MKKQNRIGEIYITNEGYNIEIIEHFDCKSYTIKFEDGTIIKNRRYTSIKNGQIKNPNHKSVLEVGYFGIGIYSKTTHLKIYYAWGRMLQRCYSKKYQEKHPTYKGCTVDEYWHNFQNFAEWYETNRIEDCHLDKNILFKGNKVYSSETCCFVPREINGLFVKCNNSRGKLPIGVSMEGDKFRASVHTDGKVDNLGLFNTLEEAFQAYKIAKERYIKKVADNWKPYIEPKVYEAMYNYEVEITD